MATMPFGKFKGQPIYSLPGWYLKWLLEEAEIRNPALLSELQAERQSRAGRQDGFNFGREEQHGNGKRYKETEYGRQQTPPAEIREFCVKIVESGYRSQAKVNHPDSGGTHQKMILLTEAVDYLRRLFRK